MLDENAIEEIFDKINNLADAPSEVVDHLVQMTGRDEMTGPVYEILSGKRWFPVTKALWTGWTGLRRLNGEEHHGPITYLDSPGRAYHGKRTCGCGVCEVGLPPSLRKN
jgi:hypothetical protein